MEYGYHENESVISPQELAYSYQQTFGGPNSPRIGTDFSARYNTGLSNEERPEFEAWLDRVGRRGEERDYDLQGYWKEMVLTGKEAGDKSSRQNDRWKKPNHITFSDKSMYAKEGDEDFQGGAWHQDGNGTRHYNPRRRMTQQELEHMRWYFQNYEKDAVLDESGVNLVPTSDPLDYTERRPLMLGWRDAVKKGFLGLLTDTAVTYGSDFAAWTDNKYDDEAMRRFRKWAKEKTELDPAETSAAASVVHGVIRYIGKAGLYGAAGASLYGLAAVRGGGGGGAAAARGIQLATALGVANEISAVQYWNLLDENVSRETAAKARAWSFGVNTAAFAIPLLGKSRISAMAIGGGLNAGAEVLERGGVQKILDDANYKELGEKYGVTKEDVLIAAGAGALFAGLVYRPVRLPREGAAWRKPKQPGPVIDVPYEDVGAPRERPALEGPSNNPQLTGPGQNPQLTGPDRPAAITGPGQRPRLPAPETVEPAQIQGRAPGGETPQMPGRVRTTTPQTTGRQYDFDAPAPDAPATTEPPVHVRNEVPQHIKDRAAQQAELEELWTKKLEGGMVLTNGRIIKPFSHEQAVAQARANVEEVSVRSDREGRPIRDIAIDVVWDVDGRIAIRERPGPNGGDAAHVSQSEFDDMADSARARVRAREQTPTPATAPERRPQTSRTREPAGGWMFVATPVTEGGIRAARRRGNRSVAKDSLGSMVVFRKDDPMTGAGIGIWGANNKGIMLIGRRSQLDKSAQRHLRRNKETIRAKMGSYQYPAQAKDMALGRYVGAMVPKGTSPDVLDTLRANKLEIWEYDATDTTAAGLQARNEQLGDLLNTLQERDSRFLFSEEAGPADEARDASRRRYDDLTVHEAKLVGRLKTRGKLKTRELQDEAAEQIRHTHERFPPEEGWMPISLEEVSLNKKGDLIYKWKKIPYGLTADGFGGTLKKGSPEYAERVELMSRKCHSELHDVVVLADRDTARLSAQEIQETMTARAILGQIDWYLNMQKLTYGDFGRAAPMFTDLLGATSPQTGVKDNLAQSLHALEQFWREYANKMPQYLDWRNKRDAADQRLQGYTDALIAPARRKHPPVDSDAYREGYALGETDLREKFGGDYQSQAAVKQIQKYTQLINEYKAARELPDDLTPLQAERLNGKGQLERPKYNLNSGNVFKALIDDWRTVRNEDPFLGRGPVAPKARTFSGNLAGWADRGTIDLWAARYFRRLIYGYTGNPVFKRIPPIAETGVGGSLKASGETTGEFGIGNDIMGRTLDLVKDDPAIINSSNKERNMRFMALTKYDLQAIEWFIEKAIWSKHKWTSTQGEGGSLDELGWYVGQNEMKLVKDLYSTAKSNDANTPPEIKEDARRELDKLVERPFRVLMGSRGTPIEMHNPEKASYRVSRLLSTVAEGDALHPNSVIFVDGATTVRPGGKTAMDFELSARANYRYSDLKAEAIRQGMANNEPSIAITRALRKGDKTHKADPVDPRRHRVGMLIPLKNAMEVGSPELEAVTRRIKNICADIFEPRHPQLEFTYYTDPRRSRGEGTGDVPTRVVGLRTILQPENTNGYAPNGERWLEMSRSQIATLMQHEEERYREIADVLAKTVDEVSRPDVAMYATEIIYKSEYKKRLKELENDSRTVKDLAADDSQGDDIWDGVLRAMENGAASPDDRLFKTDKTGLRYGAYDTKTGTIHLTQNADILTFTHENSHWYMDEMFKAAAKKDAHPMDVQDTQILLDHWGISRSRWYKMGLQAKRKYYERFATYVEIFMARGEAVSGMRDVMVHFFEWIRDLYDKKAHRSTTVEERVAAIKKRYKDRFGEDLPEPTEEVWGVIRRMFGEDAPDSEAGRYVPTEEEVEAARLLLQRDELTDNMTAPFKDPGSTEAYRKGADMLFRAEDQVESGHLPDVGQDVRPGALDKEFLNDVKARLKSSMEQMTGRNADFMRLFMDDGAKPEIKASEPAVSLEARLKAVGSESVDMPADGTAPAVNGNLTGTVQELAAALREQGTIQGDALADAMELYPGRVFSFQGADGKVVKMTAGELAERVANSKQRAESIGDVVNKVVHCALRNGGFD